MCYSDLHCWTVKPAIVYLCSALLASLYSYRSIVRRITIKELALLPYPALFRALRNVLAILFFSVSIAGCAPLTILNATVGASDYHLVADQAYGKEIRQKLDIYIPEKSVNNADVVIFFYGGRWQTGEKIDYRFVAEGLAANGFISVVPDYRLSPHVDWRDIINDGALAYQWVETHIKFYHGNPRRIFLMGHSSGAHIAAMVALDQEVRIKAGSHIAPCGMVGLAGPYDFYPFIDADVRQLFSTAARPMDTQPISYADGSNPSLLLLTGDADATVNPLNSYHLAKAIQAHGGKAKVISYSEVGHSGILISLARSLPFLAPTLKDTSDFIRKTTCGL